MNITKGVTASAQKVVIYGTEGIGKTSFAAQFPNPLFIDTEGSTTNMDVARMDRPTSWQMLNQQIDFVKNNRPCDTVIIDTFDWAEQLAANDVISRGNKKSITDFGYGEGFIQLEEVVGSFLNKLSDLVETGINVVLTAHATVRRFEAPDEMGAYDRYELKLGNKTTAKTAALVKEWADMVLFFNYKVFSVASDDKGTKFKGQGGVRTMYAEHHPAWDAKNRHGLPGEMPMDFNQIEHIFNAQAPVNQAPINHQPVQEPVNQPVSETPNEVPPQTEQVQQAQQAPQNTATTESEQPEQVTNELDPNIPKSLRDLMIQHGVSEQQIRDVVGSKGYYPADTPITNYDPNFIEGVLVGAWDQVHGEVIEMALPF